MSEKKSDFKNEINEEYEKLKDSYNNNKATKLISLEEARKNKFICDWDNYNPTKPTFEGVKYYDNIPAEEIVDYIDWTPFFFTWEMRKKYPAILEDKIFGEQAKQLLEDANAMLDNIIKNNWLKAKAVIGVWRANSDGDDVHLYDNDEQIATYNFLRQQGKKSKSNRCLSDFVAPLTSEKQDYMGSFVCTAGLEIENQLFIKNRAQFNAKLSGNDIAVFNANDIMPTNADGTIPFRQNNDLFWLSGVDQEESILIISVGPQNKISGGRNLQKHQYCYSQ